MRFVRHGAPPPLSRWTRTRDLPDATYDSSVASVFHLFGRYSNSPEYAVTEEDTLEFMHLLQSDVKRPQNLFRDLYTKTCVASQGAKP